LHRVGIEAEFESSQGHRCKSTFSKLISGFGLKFKRFKNNTTS
jgi:hypothetical protein